MAINFPDSPSINDTYTYNDKTWKWNSSAWERSTETETGNTEGNTGEVAYYDGVGSIIKGATAFYYDSTNLKVGIGTSVPDQTLGVSGDFYVSAGATFGGDVSFLGNAIVATGGYLQWSDGTTQDTRENITFLLNGAALSPTDEPHRTLDLVSPDQDEIILATIGTPPDTAKYTFALGNNVPKLDEDSTFTTYNFCTSAWGAYRFAGGSSIAEANLASVDAPTSTYMGITSGTINYKILGTDILDMDTDIHAFVGISADAGATFANDINVNDLTVGKGGGDRATNTAVGYQSLFSNTEGDFNVASGYQALYSNTEGDGNVASGFEALYYNTEGDQNVASGYRALYLNTEGSYNVAYGVWALYSNTEGDDNVAYGYQALYGNTGGDGNVAVGYQALFSNTEGYHNVASGYRALYSNTEGNYNVAVGIRALYSNTEGDGNVASGFEALRDNTEGGHNVAFGTSALYSNTEGSYNVASGYRALYLNTEGDNNVASGSYALYNNTEGDNNVASGSYALYNNTVGDDNVASGHSTGRSILGSNNTAIGKEAGYDRFNDYTGSNNTYIGYNAQPSSATVNNEIVLGDSNVTLIHSAAGMSMGGGALFGGNGGGGITCDNLNVGGYWAGEQSDYVGIAIDNGTSVITTGKKSHRIIPWDCEVVEWTISSADSGRIQWDINWCTYANWPSTASVGGSNLPGIAISVGPKAQDTSVDWAKTTFAAGDIIEFEVDSVESLTNCILSIKIRRTG